MCFHLHYSIKIIPAVRCTLRSRPSRSPPLAGARSCSCSCSTLHFYSGCQAVAAGIGRDQAPLRLQRLPHQRLRRIAPVAPDTPRRVSVRQCASAPGDPGQGAAADAVCIAETVSRTRSYRKAGSRLPTRHGAVLRQARIGQGEAGDAQQAGTQVGHLHAQPAGGHRTQVKSARLRLWRSSLGQPDNTTGACFKASPLTACPACRWAVVPLASRTSGASAGF